MEALNSKLSLIVRKYRKKKKMSVRDFAAELSDGLDKGYISGVAVNNWENEVHGIKLQYLINLAKQTTDWRHLFALDCMAARSDFYSPVGEIGRRILGDRDGE